MGCYSAHSGIKRLNRQTENSLLMAETWSAIASFYGYAYPTQEFEASWRRLLFNQFHDILAGSSIASAYQDAHHELGEALAPER